MDGGLGFWPPSVVVMLLFVERLSPRTAGTVHGLLSGVYFLLMMWLVADGRLAIFESTVIFVVYWVWSTSLIAKRRERLNLPGEPPLTADERILAARACASGHPSEDSRIRSASAKIARGWSGPSPLGKREYIFFAVMLVFLIVMSLIGFRPWAFLGIALSLGLFAYVIGSGRRHRDQARIYVMAAEEMSALQSSGQTGQAEAAE
jgi:Ca2+/Na+ antiporter